MLELSCYEDLFSTFFHPFTPLSSVLAFSIFPPIKVLLISDIITFVVETLEFLQAFGRKFCFKDMRELTQHGELSDTVAIDHLKGLFELFCMTYLL